jgi:hypothetical protein
VTSSDAADVWSSSERTLRTIRPTIRGYLAAIGFAGTTIAAIIAPSPASIALATSIAAALIVALLSVLFGSRRGHRRLVATLSAPESVPRAGLASLRLALVGDPPSLGCRLSFDRSSTRWFRGAAESIQGRTRRRVVAPSAIGSLRPRSDAGFGIPHGVLAVPTGRRGILTCRWAALWLYDPVAIFGTRLVTFSDLKVVVHPRAIRSPLTEADQDVRALEEIDALGHRATSEGVDLLGIRPYQPGDRLSSIHWRSLSSTVPLLVRELGTESPNPQHLVIDDRAGVHRRADFEKVLDLATGAVVDRPATGPSIELRSLSSGQVLLASPSSVLAVLRWLAALEPRRADGERFGVGCSGAALGLGDTVITTTTGSASLGAVRRQGARVVVVQ